tara:strand:- start:644 stop:1024 length:381 start_codon:yes stop_codon:yes gene_type:complete
MEIRTFQGDDDILAEVGIEDPKGRYWNVTIITANAGGVNNPSLPELIVPSLGEAGSREEPARIIVAYDLEYLSEQFQRAIERADEESEYFDSEDREMYMQTAGAGVLNLALNRALLRVQDYIETHE